MKPGRCETITHDYKRQGTSTLFAVLNTLTGEVIGECKKRHRHQEFLSFLKTVEKQTPGELAQQTKAMSVRALDPVNVDSTLPEKAITFATDVRLYNKMRTVWVAAAEKR